MIFEVKLDNGLVPTAGIYSKTMKDILSHN
jgi:hypothetical protein